MPGKAGIPFLVKKMKVLLAIFSAFLMSVSADKERNLVAWVIEPSSSLVINGASNVNQFTCGLGKYAYADTLELQERTATYIRFSPNKLSLPVVDFDCKNKLITNDFQETLQSGRYPQIGISFLSFELIPTSGSSVDSYDAKVLIELSGQKRTVNIRFDFWEKSYGLYNLIGNKALNFSDFGLEPPTKMMGLVKVDDELSITFNLVVRPL